MISNTDTETVRHGDAETTTAAPVTFDYATAERTIIDRAEFARLIRKHGSVSICVFAPDYLRDEIVRGAVDTCFHVTIPRKQALESLARGNYDAHEWDLTQHGLSVRTYLVAPAWLQIQRRRELVTAQIASREERLAKPPHPTCEWDVRSRANADRDLANARAELARWDAELAARRQQPVAA